MDEARESARSAVLIVSPIGRESIMRSRFLTRSSVCYSKLAHGKFMAIGF